MPIATKGNALLDGMSLEDAVKNFESHIKPALRGEDPESKAKLEGYIAEYEADEDARNKKKKEFLATANGEA